MQVGHRGCIWSDWRWRSGRGAAARTVQKPHVLAAQAHRLAARYVVLYVDLRGHGVNDVPEQA